MREELEQRLGRERGQILKGREDGVLLFRRRFTQFGQ
jgi:hypothetical protein